ncbi:MAG: T9SS type A sorting domain-containing protein [Fluviicola sp.]|nr:T9SS type A sorting domain-containing protein [Fluviicola sp.]
MKSILSLFAILSINLSLQAQTWTYAGAGGSANAENGKAICVDVAGNVYVTGSFSNTVDFDLGAGTANLTSNGSNDIFIASYTSAGVYRWAVRAGGIAADNNSPSGGICTDGVSVYVTGSYNGAATLFGGISLTPNGGAGTDAFVAKLNCTTGAFTWAVSMGGTGSVDTGVAMCLDPSGNPYLLGSFNLTMSGACGNVSLGGSDIFVSRLNPTTGACVWMASGGSATNDGTLGGGICYDLNTTELVVASTTNTGLATFGGFNVTSVGGIDMCVLELNSTTGAWLGAVGSGSATTDDAIACAYDPSTTNVMVCGAFTNNMTLPGGISLTASSAGIQDAWWGSYSVSTNGFVWARAAVGTGLDRANGIAVDGNGSVLITGQYVNNPTTFGALSLTNTNSGGFDDMFVVSYSAAAGTEMWATKNTNSAGPQTSLAAGRSIAYAGSNNYWTTGQSTVGTTFNVALPSNGFADLFVAKLNTPPPLTATQSQVNLTCNAVCTGSATVVASGGTTPYTYSWSPSGGTGATASSLCAGTYTCTITDAASSSITKTFTLTQPPAITVTPNSQTNVSCFGGSNGAASINTPTGGTGGYTYNWTPGNPTGDGTISVTGLSAQTYTCTVTDANSCTRTQNFTVTAPTAITVTPASQTNVSCFGGSNGAASINTPTGGAGGYTYDWTPGTPTGDGTTSITGLSAQTYTCTVTDANGCTRTQNFTITAPTAITVTPASQTNVSCFGGSNGAASINTPTGGAGGYTYNWTPGNPTGDGTVSVTGLTAQTYTCTVTDANSCTRTQNFTITAPTALVVTPASQTNVSCFGGSNGAASINTPTGGAGGYTYNWTPGNPTGDGTVSVTGLSATTYTCTVTDANSCTATQNFTITAPTAITVTPASQTNVSCFGGSNGAASINTPTGGAGGYTYNWTPGNPTGDGTVSVTGLTATTWTCTVTDANSCTRTQNFTITAPTAIVVTPASQTNISCFGGSNGAASINTPTGGAGGYTYNWTPGNPTGDGTTSVTGLTAQTYTCTVTDANSCTATQNFTITAPTALVVTPASQTNVSCFGGSNGAASINTPTGGAGGYTYNWTPGNPTGDGTVSVTGLSATTYTCTVTDANSCTATQNFTITAPTALVVTPASQTNVSCFGGSNGAASINTPTGGAGGYTYNWTPGNPTGDGTVSVTGLIATTYTCTVTDANSCTATQNFTITAPTAIAVTPASQTNVSCFGGSNGAASINTPTGGAGGYTYNWTPGNPTGDGTVSVTGLTAQTYTCTVTDANGCAASQNFTITSPMAITASISSTATGCTVNNGTATVSSVSGGAGGYTYLWSPSGGSGSVATNLGVGTYTCTITDANGCTIAPSVAVTTIAAPTLTAASQTNVSCFGGSNGAAAVNAATGGAGGYTYDWTPGNPTGDGTVSVTGLTAQTYTCTVTDANGCTAAQNFTITAPTALVVTPASQTNVSCFGGSNGAASINTPTGGAGGYTYNWTPGNPTGDGTTSVTGLTAQTYTCTVTDANSCTATQNFTITAPTALVVTPASQTNVSCFGGSNGAASINTPTGGAGGYTYNWTPGNPTGDGTTSVTGLTAQIYTCTVTDVNGCTASQNFTITAPTALVVTPASQTNVSCFGGSNGAASINTPTGGASGYTYDWTPGTPTGDGTVSVTGLTAQTYTCTVTDANGCTTSQVFTITQPAAITASLSQTACDSYTLNGSTYTTTGTYVQNLTAVNGCDSTLTLNLTINNSSSSSTPVTACDSYTWTNGTTYTSSGTFSQLLTNAVGCDSIATLVLTINNSTTSTTTASACDSYTWTNGTTYTASGTYFQTLTNGIGCDSTASLVLTINTSTSSADTVIACDSYMWSADGQTYTTSGDYSATLTNAAGCDSIATLNLTLFFGSNTDQTATACDTYTWVEDGQTYSSSGSYVATYQSVNGCDSTITLNLTINNSVSNTESVAACVDYTWVVTGTTYTTTGIYSDTLTTVNGCDSILVLDLTITGFPTAVATDNGDATITASVGTGYQWIDCSNNAEIVGATSQTLTVTQNGDYAVVVTNAGGCSDTSDCVNIDYIGLMEQHTDAINVFPNPTDATVTIQLNAIDAQLELLDANGKVLQTNRFSNETILNLTTYPVGVYLVRVKTTEQTIVKRLVKQ